MNCISIDWFQIHVKINKSVISELENAGNYSLVVKQIKHAIFKDHRQILFENGNDLEECAVISFSPLSSILPHDSAHLKINNKYLYQSDLEMFVSNIIKQLQLKFVSVSRLDLCLDIKKFYKESCPSFIKKFLTKKYLKRISTTFHLDGNATRSMPIHYLRFGTKNSDAQFYIYNKSKELREKTEKPYIKEKWLQHKLNYKAYDVWRFEFVLHPSQFAVIDSTTGETLSFNSLEVLNYTFLQSLFYALVERYAVFVINDGQVRKERMKRLQLFKESKDVGLYMKISEKQTSNRMDKVLIKKLYQLNHEWRILSQDSVSLEDALSEYIDKKGLKEWFDNKMNTENLNLKKHDNKTPERESNICDQKGFLQVTDLFQI